MDDISAQDLRDIVADAISPTIEIHRAAKSFSEREHYIIPVGSPTEEEIDNFLCSNIFLSWDVIEQLIQPGLLGFRTKSIQASHRWIKDFRAKTKNWASRNEWLTADVNKEELLISTEPSSTKLWVPNANQPPTWLSTSPTCVLIAANILRQGKLLSELKPRDFEELVGLLLEAEGWKVTVTQQSRDGGIDVIATINDPVLGEVRSIWQAKKYKPSNSVKLRDVRELSAVRDEQKATKGMMITTSRLTRDAVAWINQDIYRLGFKEHKDVENWIQDVIAGKVNP